MTQCSASLVFASRSESFATRRRCRSVSRLRGVELPDEAPGSVLQGQMSTHCMVAADGMTHSTNVSNLLLKKVGSSRPCTIESTWSLRHFRRARPRAHR